MDLIDLEISRTIAAAPGAIYDAWLDATKPGGPWYGCDRVILNPVVDGLFYHSVQHAGREWAHYGRFIRLERPALIEHSWMSEATQAVDTIVTLTLEPQGDGALVTLRQARVPDDAMGRQHKDGWTFILDAIAARLQRA